VTDFIVLVSIGLIQREKQVGMQTYRSARMGDWYRCGIQQKTEIHSKLHGF